MSSSRLARSAFFAVKNWSCANLKRFQSFASSPFLPRPVAFHRSIRALKRRAVATQSVDVASFSASATRSFLASATFPCSASRAAKCVRRRLSNLCREEEKRFHRSASIFFSNRGAAFHSSRSTLRRSPVTFQLSESASDSASTTIFSLTRTASAFFAALRAASSAFLASYAPRVSSMSGEIRSTETARAARSPTPLSSLTWWRKRLTAIAASEGTMAPLRTRAARSATSDAAASNFLTK